MPSYDPYNEASARQTGIAPPSYLASPQGAQTGAGWQGTIGGTRMILGGLPAGATQAEAEAFYRNSTAYQRSAGMGYLSPEAYAQLNPNASAEDLAGYDKTYGAQQRQTNTGPGGVGDSLIKAGQFELDRAGHLIKSVAHDPSRLLTGVDPASTGLWNNVLGTKNEALVGQLGGATENDFNRYEQQNGFGSLGGARGMSTSADYIAGMFGAAGAMHGLGQAAGSIGNGGGAPTGNDLGIFSNGGRAGMGEVGLDNMGLMASRGLIQGGAGTGIMGSLGGRGLLSSGSIGNAAQLHDLISGGGSGGGGSGGGGGAAQQPSYGMPNLSGMLGSQTTPQQSTPSYMPLSTETPYYMPTRGFNAHDFYGAKVWT